MKREGVVVTVIMMANQKYILLMLSKFTFVVAKILDNLTVSLGMFLLLMLHKNAIFKSEAFL